MNHAVTTSRGACYVLLAAICVGCVKEDRSTPATGPVPARSVVERGPVRLTVEVVPPQPQLSDEPQLKLTVEAAAGVRVETPAFGEAFGEFLIRDFDEPLPEFAEDGTQIVRQVYTLEPMQAGSLTIAPIAVHFDDERPQGDGQRHTIESEAVTVQVSTILPDEAPSLAELRPATGPMELTPQGISAGWWILGGVLLVAGTWMAVWWRRRLHAESTVPGLSPGELARLELEQLMAQRLAENDVKAYYVQLTGIVRRFIERSTGVRAPEQTTEEFLREIAGHERFASDEQQRLREFLQAADLVKFAGYRPDPQDVAASLERAQRFIELERRTLEEMPA